MKNWSNGKSGFSFSDFLPVILLVVVRSLRWGRGGKDERMSACRPGGKVSPPEKAETTPDGPSVELALGDKIMEA